MDNSNNAANQPGPLYETPPKIHPRSVTGFYRRLKDYFLWGLLIIYHFSPWLRWDRGEGSPNQAILFDIGEGRIYLFDMVIWPQDIYILTGVMILAAVGLFFSAALLGRAWCGFACFQTLWTDLFMKVEAWVEGDRNARIKLDKAPWSFNKVVKRATKHTIWLLIAAFFSLSFLWYFFDAAEITKNVFTLNIGGWTLATFGTMMAMTYIMAGFAREQVCLYMCPYGRFQGVMFDEHSKVITYEEWRGEDRGKPGKNRDFTDRGHCVDCSLCVQVCPTGIDIREGQQMGCIGCGLCIDACDDVMEKFKLPTKLISNDSAHNVALRASTKGKNLKPQKTPWMRPRTIAYSVILGLTMIITTVGFQTREQTKISVMKDRAPLYVRLSTGQIQNGYTVRILNKEKEDRTFQLRMRGDFNPELSIVGHDAQNIEVGAGEAVTLRVIVRNTADVTGTDKLELLLSDPYHLTHHKVTTVFNSPS